MGNVIVGQSGGPTAVINASLAGVIKASKKAGIKKVYGMHHGIEGFLKEDLIDLDDYIQSTADLSLLKRTPSAFLGSCRYKLPEIEADTLFAGLDKNNLNNGKIAVPIPYQPDKETYNFYVTDWKQQALICQKPGISFWMTLQNGTMLSKLRI